MSRHRDFTALAPPPEAVSFTLSGTDATGHSWEEKFLCVARVAPQAMADLAMAMRVDMEGNRVWNASSVISFIRRALADDDSRQRWALLMNDNSRAVDLQDDLGPLLLWLAEEYTARPTQLPST
jgi:hypothetical protein